MRGTRSTAELNGRVDEAPPRSRRRRTSLGEITQPWPMMRMARFMDIDDMEVYAWDEFFNKLGQRNRSLGRARAAGSVALTYISGVDFNKMLLEKYDSFRQSSAKAVKLQRQLSAELREFMRSNAAIERHNSTGRLVMDHYLSVENSMGLDTREDNFYSAADQVASLDLTPVEEDRLGSCVYAKSTLAVNGLSLYGRNKLGLDLSTNDQLFNERDQVVSFLRASGFNTNHISSEWSPHAVVFDGFDHISGCSQLVKYKHQSLPEYRKTSRYYSYSHLS